MSSRIAERPLLIQESARLIKAALEERDGGRIWSVHVESGGVSYDWLKITSPPDRRSARDMLMTPEDRQALAKLMGFLFKDIPPSGLLIAGRGARLSEFVSRSRGGYRG